MSRPEPRCCSVFLSVLYTRLYSEVLDGNGDVSHLMLLMSCKFALDCNAAVRTLRGLMHEASARCASGSRSDSEVCVEQVRA
ncbi:hypothetical protein DPX16_21869 [Anabarilius grahami]|uniref:Uncharacterized protein n=1 Tax=Anabarilius grahami TaxID=495550 RepID=A0A3N0XM62_ANAGA|nr:hypothetical protein DPX16_21869 [Anabarilius grahami]